MGNCCHESGQSKQPEIVFKNGKIQPKQLDTVQKYVAIPTNKIVEDDHQRQIQKLKQEYEDKVRKLNQRLERQSSDAIKLQQQLNRARQSKIRINETSQELAQIQKKEKQQQDQERARLKYEKDQLEQENQRLQRQIYEKDKSSQQRQRSIQSTVNSNWQKKVSQAKNNEEKKLILLKNQLDQKQKELLKIQTQIKDQKAKYKEDEVRLRRELQKLPVYKQQIQKLQRQLNQEKKVSTLANQRLQQIRFNQLFQNEIFAEKQYYKKYFTTSLQERYNRRIIKTKMLFAYDKDNKINFHKSIDQLPNIAMIIRLSNGYYVAGYSEGPFIPKVAANSDALLISITNKRIFYLMEENRRGITYDDYYIIFGNSELRVRSQQNRVFSNFGISNSYFSNRGETVNILLGQGNQREVNLAYYEIYQIFFDSI